VCISLAYVVSLDEHSCFGFSLRKFMLNILSSFVLEIRFEYELRQAMKLSIMDVLRASEVFVIHRYSCLNVSFSKMEC